MKKMVLMGRSEAGKTTLTQALRGEEIHYDKTQYVKHGEMSLTRRGIFPEPQARKGACTVYIRSGYCRTSLFRYRAIQSFSTGVRIPGEP